MGQTTGPPDFVGVGAHRAGTSWWHGLICAHPEAFVPEGAEKELHFFDRYWNRPFRAEDVETYHRCFPRPPKRFVGEWTPRYMYDSWTPRLLSAAAPEAKILVLLRDPLERYHSALADAAGIARCRGRELGPAAVAEALARSLYRYQLARVLEHFPRERVLVLQFERCRDNPREELQRTYEFLGVEDFAADPAAVGRNVQPEGVVLPGGVLAEDILPTLAEDVRGLLSLVPDLDVDRWPSVAGSV